MNGPSPSSVLLLGATGLVGGECLRLLAGDAAFSRVVALTRRPLPALSLPPAAAAKVEERVVDFERLEDDADAMRVEQVICALGTTRRAAGSRARFRAVDLGYPLEVARLAREQGADHFLLVSAIGADPDSRFFYSRVKGELEEAVAALPFPRVTIIRPSLLLGEREELRLGEWTAEKLSFLAPRRLRPVQASAVAAALVLAAREDRVGQRVIESWEIEALARRYHATPS